MKIVVINGFSVNPLHKAWEQLKNCGECEFHDNINPNDSELIIEKIGDANILITAQALITEKVLEACHNLEYIGMMSTANNLVDLNVAYQKKIVVTNVPNYSTYSVAQYTIGLLLEICNKTSIYTDMVREGKWTEARKYHTGDYKIIELKNKTLGIVGYGNIGKQVANIAKALGMNVIVNTLNYQDVNTEADIRFVNKDELYSKSDIISLNCDLNETTLGLINSNTFEKMKDGVIIINTARGPIINEQDLVSALDSGKVYAVGLDTITKEPIEDDNPLLNYKNCIITPHISAAARESMNRLISWVCDNVISYLEGDPKNIIDSESNIVHGRYK